MKSITFLFPGFKYVPVGGYKIPLEYANMLSDDGYDVHIVYGESVKYAQGVPFFVSLRLHLRILLLKFGIKKRSIRIWFPLNKGIKEHPVYTLDYKHVPKTDIYICTAVDTAPFLNQYPISSNYKYYFIQGYETWGRTDNDVRETYHYDMNKIVISSWLKEIVSDEEKEPCVLVRNGFDTDCFYISKPIEERGRYEVSMLYHKEEMKGCDTTFAALEIVKKKHPQLHVNVFGTPNRPHEMPDWYSYYQCPSLEEHLRINNDSAIYVAASIEEGWGLTIGEAMLCGQAVACTENRGFREMAIDGDTALTSPVKDPQALADNILRLIENDELRYSIAHNGHEYVSKMTKSNAYHNFKNILDGYGK
ncbi:MAG: glycosyltransferase family 4 protein [Prevotella sp.]|nr:glycosyltransferase family 4 protein [Prevotella sp.]